MKPVITSQATVIYLNMVIRLAHENFIGRETIEECSGFMNNKKFYALLFSTIMVVGIVSPFLFATPTQGATVQVTPTIKITLLTPGANPERRQHALLITNNLVDLGVQAQRVLVPFSPDAYSRALQPAAADVGKTYDQGGFDVLFVGYAMSPEPNPFALMDSSQFPPSGQNYYLWNDTTNDALCRAIIAETNATHRQELLWQWQVYAYSQLPEITIFSTREVIAFSPHLDWKPFNQYHYPAWPGVEQWNYTSSALDHVTIAQTGQAGPAGEGLSVYHSTSYYDLTVSGPIYGELAGYDIFTRDTAWNMIPLMASSYIASSRWLNFTIKPNIYFHNGEILDGRDYVATLRSVITPAFGAATGSYLAGILGTDAKGYGNKSLWYAGEAGTNGSTMALNYNQVCIHLPSPWAYILADLGGATVYPASLLVNSSSYNWASGSAKITPDPTTLAKFATTSFNTGGTDAYKYYAKNGSLVSSVGPIGAGPYQWVGYNPTTLTCHLTKNNNYFNATWLETTKHVYKIKDYYVQNIEDLAPAITALQAGDVQVLDSQYSLPGSLSLLAPAWSNYTAYNAFGLQEMGFNMKHPVFGTGVDTPLGQQYPALAATAAAHVRRAIEYMIPKDQIIKTLLNGYGAMGLMTSVLPPMAGGVFNTAITIRNETAANAKFLAQQELRAAGYDFVPVITPGFFETYGLLLAVVELAVIVVIAGFYFYRPRKA